MYRGSKYNYDKIDEGYKYLDFLLGSDIVVPFLQYQPSINNAKYRRKSIIESESGRENIIIQENKNKSGPGC